MVTLARAAVRAVLSAGDRMMPVRRNTALLFAVFAATALAVTTAAGSAAVPSSGTQFQRNATNASADASITIENQTRAGRSVYVESVTLPDGGFVLLTERSPNGTTVVGVSLPIPPGTHSGRITFRGVPGADLNKSRLGANTTLVATLYRDTDGDGRFEGLVSQSTDGPYIENGTPVRDRVHVTIPRSERPRTAAVNFSNQSSNGTTVTIESVTLPEGGYVAVHRGRYNASNATRSLLGATEYLTPGTYRNVTVTVGTVPGANGSPSNRPVRLTAVVYRDSDGDHRFQFVSSNASEDNPYTDGGPVSDGALVAIVSPVDETTPAGDTQTATGNTTTVTETATENTTIVTKTATGNTTTATETATDTATTATTETATTATTETATTATTETATTLTTETATTPTETATTATATETTTTATATSVRTATPQSTTAATGVPTATTDETQESRHRITAYGGESNGREGILENPLFPLLVLTFAVFVVLVVRGGQ